MPLRVAPCPRCSGPIVFGERQCRACGQTFDYGAAAPALPTQAQVWEALASVGVAVPGAPAPPPAAAPVQPVVQQPTAKPPSMAELDSGRFETPAQVAVQELEGFFETALFRAATPQHVNAPSVPGLEQTSQDRVGEVQVQRPPDVEISPVRVGDVRAAPLQDIFHSDFMKAPDNVQTAMLDGIDASPGAYVERKRAPATPGSNRASRAANREAKSISDLTKIVCRCGETHRLPRCASCGTAHPDLA